jgi:general secretion pathway protein F/type IV pilus assembly protein PilC
MPSFAYTALSAAGQQISGKLQVASRAEAYKRLEAQALTPISVMEESGKKHSSRDTSSKAKTVLLKRAQLILFTEELADLLDGGIQIDQALRILEERQDSNEVKQISAILRNELREGSTIAKALQKASPSFDDLYVNLVAAGEVSGSLTSVLRRLASNMTVIHELQAKVTQAMIYPIILILGCVGLVIVVMTVLVPQLTDLLSSSGTQLPLTTQLLMQFSAFLAQWWWVLLAAGTVIFLSFKAYISTSAGKHWWHRARMHLPLFGPVISTRFYAQLAHSLGNLINNGVPLLSGLKLTAKGTGNLFMYSLLQRIIELVGEGSTLSSAMRKVGSFPALLSDMIAVGEQTGGLGRSLEKTAKRYDKELDHKIKRITALITPVVLIFMAIVVGAVAYSIVTAIFQTSQSIRSKA